MRILLFIALAVCALAFYEVNAGHGGCHYEGKDVDYEPGSKFKHECLKCRCNNKGVVKCEKNGYCEKECKYVKYKNCTEATCSKISCPFGSYTPPRRCCPMCHKRPKIPQNFMKMTKSQVICSEVTCRMYCEYGFKKDTDGCDICECKMKPETMVMNECKPEVCKMYCEFGFKTDENGCEKCECKMNPCKADPSPCPDDKPVCVVMNKKAVCKRCPVCTMCCQYGLKTDDNDCPKCECRENPCAEPEKVCSEEMPYCVVKCNKAVCQKCSPPMCMRHCSFGFKKNSDGCEICECKHNPCMDKECPPYHMCYVQKDSMCKWVHCPPVAKCKAHPFLACKKPEKDATGNFKMCAGQDMVNCSDGYNCHMSPGHYPSVCCPSAQCKYGEKIYNIYDTFDSHDGCNKCFCMANGNIGCTLMACPKRDCNHNGETYKHGDSFNRGDGCNTCKCMDGKAACTKMYCPYCKENYRIYGIGDYVDRNDTCQICQCINDPCLDPCKNKEATIACAFKNNCTSDSAPRGKSYP